MTGTANWRWSKSPASNPTARGPERNLFTVSTTAYSLLFLSRGRHPIFMNKLRFDGYWANRPRDIANLSHYATTVLERPLNWQVVSLKSATPDRLDGFTGAVHRQP